MSQVLAKTVLPLLGLQRRNLNQATIVWVYSVKTLNP